MSVSLNARCRGDLAIFTSTSTSTLIDPLPSPLDLVPGPNRPLKVVSDTMVVSAYRGAGYNVRWWSLVTNRGCRVGGDGGGVTDVRGRFVDGLLTQVGAGQCILLLFLLFQSTFELKKIYIKFNKNIFV